MTMIERNLPLQTSLNIDDGEEDKPFRILNQDNLPLSVVGENVFKPFGSNNHKKKPNGIVYPTRRLDLSDQLMNQQQKQFTRSNGHLSIIQKNEDNCISYKKLSSSHGNLSQANKNKCQDDFVKNLDAKLRKLQNDKKRHDNNSHIKKPFVTTVTKGKFLEAPEKIPKITVHDDQGSKVREKTPKKELYAYVSKPTVLSRSPPQNVHRSRCEAAATAAGLPFLNHVEEEPKKNQRPRKKRETDFTDVSSPERKAQRADKEYLQNTQSANQSNLEDIQSKESRAEIAKRRAIARKKAKIQSSLSICKDGDQIQSSSAVLKDSQVQTDPYLEATLVKPPHSDTDSQTDSKEMNITTTQYQNQKDTLDSATQLDPGELIEFDEELQPVLDILVGKTIESALIEILEEEELASLKEQQRRFLESRAEEQRQAEEFFEKHLIDRMNRNSRIPSMMLENYLARLIPPVVQELEDEGVLSGKYYSKNGSVLPWLVEEVSLELGDILSSGDVLKGIIQDILYRKKEIERAMNNMDEESHSREKGDEVKELVHERTIEKDVAC